MSYEILATADGPVIIHITPAIVDSHAGWRIEFYDGSETTLYQCKQEWVQHESNWLTSTALAAIGDCIDGATQYKTPLLMSGYWATLLSN
jgi:hypothetical protein